MKKSLYIMAFGLLFMNLEAQFKLPKNPLGSLTGNQEAAAPAVDISQSQANLMAQLTDALGDVAFAQSSLQRHKATKRKQLLLKELLILLKEVMPLIKKSKERWRL